MWKIDTQLALKKRIKWISTYIYTKYYIHFMFYPAIPGK